MPPSFLRRCAALVVAVMVVPTTGASTSHARPTWVSDVVDLSPRDGYANDPQVALDASGNAVAVWTQRDPSRSTYIVRAATRPAGGSWGRPATLSDGTRIAGAPQVAVTPGGDAVVVWQHNSSGLSVIQSSSWSGGAWTDPVDVSADGGFAVEPRVSVARDGTAVAAWHRDGVAQASVGTVDGSWRRPVALSGSVRADSVRVAVAPDGATVAIWRAVEGVGRIESATYRASGWTRPHTLSDNLQDVGTPEVAVDARGNAVAAWMQFSMATNALPTIHATTRSPGGSWAAPTTVSDPSRGALNPDVAIHPTSGSVVAWDVVGGPDIRVIEAATRGPGDEAWSTQSISDPGHRAVDPEIAFGTGGTAVVIWGEATSFTLPTLLLASTRAPGETWSAPDDLSDPAVRPSGPQVAVDRDGNALAVWQGLDGEHASIQTRGFDGVGPAVSAFRPARRGAVHAPLRYSARALDAWSGVRKVVWKFGDGHRATGRRVEHRFRRPGVYRVRVVTSDRLGNVTVKRARTRVSAR